MAEEWYNEITFYTGMMRDVNQRAGNILEQNRECRLLDAGQTQRLQALCGENEMLIRKMETRAFEVAVVGLENSGKSSVANALIGIPALPSASVRCTYTTTEIRADENDRALVEFYTYEEFNLRFCRMLEELGFENAMQEDYSSFPYARFEDTWQHICAGDPVRRRLYDSTTAEDVRAILKSVELICSYLGKPAVAFESAQALLSAEFQSFITGQTDPKDALCRDERPFAVKRVTIWSSRLQSMQNIVLYDVPGFNSPTVLHKEQTRAMMDRADAIVLVTDMLSNPNIDGTQLQTLREADADRVQLKDKLFVFGNKADLLTDENVYRDNMRTFVSDIVSRHRLTVERRVLAGSAKAYFDALRGKNELKDHLARFGLTPGIEELRELLTAYYNTERLRVLQNRAIHVNRAVIDLLSPVAEHFAGAELDEIQAQEFEQVIQAKDDMVAFRRAARQIIGNMYRKISRERPFTAILCKRITEQIHPITASDSLYQEVLSSLNVQGDSANRNELVNANLRMNLQGYFNALLERMVWDVARNDEMALMEELTDALLQALGYAPENEQTDKAVREHAHHVVMRMFDAEDDRGALEGGTPFRARGFIALITRFVPGLTAAVIAFPLLSQGRVEENVRYSAELTRLYADNGADEVDGISAIAKILTHKDYFSQLCRRNERALESHMKQHRGYGLNDDEQSRFVHHWSAMCSQYGIDLKNLFTPFFRLKPAKETGTGGRMAALDAALREKLIASAKLRGAEDTDTLSLPTRGDISRSLIASMAQGAEGARTEEDILREINTDIDIYAKTLTELLVPHLNLEKAFYERFINQINAMTGSSSVYDNRADLYINEWLKNDIKKIKREAFIRLDGMRRVHETRGKMYESISELLDIWKRKYETAR